MTAFAIPAEPALDRVLVLRTIADDVASIELEDVEIEVACAVVGGYLERAIVELRALADDAQLGDVCFAGALELARTQRTLVGAPTPGGRAVAVEAAQRKLIRALRASLEAARELGFPEAQVDDPTGPHLVADLTAALAVRRLYATFRRSLRRPTDESAEAVLMAVRYAAGALAIMVTDPAFAEVRASDREVLRELRDRALAWARHDRRANTGLHLLDDLWTCSDLLRGINRRQELRGHDVALIAVLGRGPDDDVPAWFDRLGALTGLDDNLDGVLERARRTGARLEALVPEALTHLARVQ